MLTYQSPLTRSAFLGQLAQTLDIPDDLADKAVAKYHELAEWLSDEESALIDLEPKIYSQGSFRLGTMVRPIGERIDYDIDLVCTLELQKEDISQAELKHLVGDRVKENFAYAAILKEGRRCWTLLPKGDFHLDILPAIPRKEENCEKNSIFITDKQLPRWQRSNPKGYSMWFKKQMIVRLNEARRTLAKAMDVNIEDVPEYRVKTPLQRAVQLLKRHRDIYFQDDKDDKPISIIITTLAAHAYDNGDDVEDSLIHIVNHMEDYIQSVNGVAYVANPIDPQENFADKWQKNPQREVKFKEWLKKARSDITRVAKAQGIDGIVGELRESFGKEVVEGTAKRLGEQMRESRERGTLYMGAGTGTLGSTGIKKVKEHDFYGG